MVVVDLRDAASDSLPFKVLHVMMMIVVMVMVMVWAKGQ
jgi:hypothetical protein